MRVKSLLQISAVTLVVVTGSASAGGGSLKDFDVQKAETWADALAICDVTRFLMTNPNLNSDVIIASSPNAKVALNKPYFIPPSGFYSEVMQSTFERVKKAGQVTPEAYNAARLHYAKVMMNAYGYTGPEEQPLLAEQMKTCYALAVDTSGKAQKTGNK